MLLAVGLTLILASLALAYAAGADRRTREQFVPLDDLLAGSRSRHPGGRDRA